MRFIIGSGLAILLTSCATSNYYPQTVSSWKGGNANSLVKKWGMPDEQLTGPAGNTIYVYKTVGYRSPSLPAQPLIGVHVGPDGRPIITSSSPSPWSRGLSLNCLAVFVANKQGTIVDTKLAGNGCYGDQGFATKMSNPA